MPGDDIRSKLYPTLNMEEAEYIEIRSAVHGCRVTAGAFISCTGTIIIRNFLRRVKYMCLMMIPERIMPSSCCAQLHFINYRAVFIRGGYRAGLPVFHVIFVTNFYKRVFE